MRWGLKSKEALAITLLTLVVVATTLVVHLAQLTRVAVEETQRQAELIAKQDQEDEDEDAKAEQKAQGQK